MGNLPVSPPVGWAILPVLQREDGQDCPSYVLQREDGQACPSYDRGGNGAASSGGKLNLRQPLRR
jgi:hypothetical protein